MDIQVWDNVLPDPVAYREAALGLPFQSYTLGDVTFHGIALAPPTVAHLIAASLPGYKPTLSFFRQSPAGQREPNFIHSDRSMGDWTSLLYLTLEPPPEDGTIFWEHGTERLDLSTTPEEIALDEARWKAPNGWAPWNGVQAAFNRMVIFPSRYYHSRAMPNNFGSGTTARLVNVTFGVL